MVSTFRPILERLQNPSGAHQRGTIKPYCPPFTSKHTDCYLESTLGRHLWRQAIPSLDCCWEGYRSHSTSRARENTFVCLVLSCNIFLSFYASSWCWPIVTWINHRTKKKPSDAHTLYLTQMFTLQPTDNTRAPPDHLPAKGCCLVLSRSSVLGRSAPHQSPGHSPNSRPTLLYFVSLCCRLATYCRLHSPGHLESSLAESL